MPDFFFEIFWRADKFGLGYQLISKVSIPLVAVNSLSHEFMLK